MADAQWQATRAPQSGGADLALMNPGGVRTDLRCAATPPCTVTYADLYAMQPYGTNLVDLDALVQHQVATSPSPDPVPRIRWVE